MENKRFDYGYCGSRDYETGVPCMVTDVLLGGNLAAVTEDDEHFIIEPCFFTKVRSVDVDFSVWQGLSPVSVCALYVSLLAEGEIDPAQCIKDYIAEFEGEEAL